LHDKCEEIKGMAQDVKDLLKTLQAMSAENERLNDLCR